ncbi:MAG: hypothetical protein ACI81V_001133 [Lentimonas sp.]|jgi:hypothetical protein
MHTFIKYGLLSLAAAMAGIQLIPVERTNPAVISDYDGPSAVKQVLQNSCYDCHSHETSWPWYSYIAPVSWLVAHDIEEGRQELNFSDWLRFAKDTPLLEEIYEEVAEGEMPLPIYLLTHSHATVSPEALALLQAEFGSKLKTKHADSNEHEEH